VLIRNAELDGRIVDVRCEMGRIRELASTLPSRASERVLEAEGGALLPGLHDHHLHLLSLAAALESVPCGPPVIRSRDELRARLLAAAPTPEGWLRGTGYHESVAGSLDRFVLDGLRDDCALRIQHRSGSMWFLNSQAIDALALADEELPPGLELDARGRPTGRLFRLDDWLRERLPLGADPGLAGVGAWLAGAGVTGVTDATPSNGAAQARLFHEAQRAGDLPQRVHLMGGLMLGGIDANERLEVGACKILLDEPALPELDELIRWIRQAHADDRAVAIHTVTRTEIYFALAALETAGPRRGDRLEHASVAPDEALNRVAHLGLTIVTQPNFVAERGDAYRRDVDPRDLPFLYRVKSWLDANVPIAGGTDAPFGQPDPWCAMRAAVERETVEGEILGPEERVSPEAALALFTTPARDPGGAPRRVAIGERADLCLLDLPWKQARTRLSRDRVRASLVDGVPIHPLAAF
jgi:predicted amidohydrolase YtcJ